LWSDVDTDAWRRSGSEGSGLIAVSAELRPDE
jgi:hypothetical protein